MTELALTAPPVTSGSTLGALRWARGVGLAVSVLAHVAVAWAAARDRVPAPAAPRRTIEVASRPRPTPRPAVAAPAPTPAPVAPAAATAPSPRPSGPPRAASAGEPPATAGKVLLAKGADDGPADFTMVTGDGVYAGGVTSRDGTSRSAVPSVAAPAPSVTASATGTAAAGGAAPPVDRSARARLRGADWGCSSLFPSGATRDEAWVSVVVTVRPDGSPASVAVVSDPGEGFGAAARACALQQTFQPALGPDGAPTLGRTAPVRVHFTR